MKKKSILFNFVTMNHSGFNIPWISKISKFQSAGFEVSYLCRNQVHRLPQIKNIYKFNDNFKKTYSHDIFKLSSKFNYMIYCFKRNLTGLSQIPVIIKTFTTVYSPSSVLDLVIIPYLVKLIHPQTIWVTVFDNIVPPKDPGNQLVRFLAWIYFKISLLMMRQANVIFASTLELNDFLLSQHFPQSQLVLSTFGIEDKLIKSSQKDKNHPYDAIFVGRINETKGIYDMLEVLKIVTHQIPNFTLAIMGEGYDETVSTFKEKIKTLGLLNHVVILGYRSGQEKFNIIKSSKMFWFLSTSESESFGIALLEAVCLGLPAIVYDLKQFQRVYQNNEVFVFQKHDLQGVAQKVIEIYQNKNIKNYSGQKLLSKYSWDKVANLEINTINNLIK